VRQTSWLPVALWPVGIAAVVAGFLILFGAEGDVTTVQVIGRSVGGSFIFCGLIAWQRRPDNRTGQLMTLTGFLFQAVPLVAEVSYTVSEVIANWWLISLAALVLGFPTGRISERIEKLIIAGFALGTGPVQVIWLLFRPVPETALLIHADAGLADAIDRYQTGFNATMGLALAVVGVSRWLRAAPPLRRLMLPTLAGSIAVLILATQAYYRAISGEFMRAGDEVTAITLVAIPLAFLFGILRAQLARAGMADLVVKLQQAPDERRLGELLSKVLHDPSLELVYWLPGFECYVDADGKPVTLPAEGSARAATQIDHDGDPVAALVHDAALTYEPELLDIVCAATDVALERERLQAELASRVEELAGSRARLVAAGDEARRRIERDLHDGAQQRLVSLAIALRLTEDRILQDPEGAVGLVAAARKEVSESLSELRELARGIHPAVLEHGLGVALDSLATRSRTPVTVACDLDERLPEAIELAAYFVASEALANVGKYAQASRATIRVFRTDASAVIEIADDGIGGADGARGSGLRGLEDRVAAVGGQLRVVSPVGGGTVLAAEMPCAVRPAAR
jgi:signal transduction histidine kinase